MPVPIITVAQMREWEQATWASGQTEQAVIARVGSLIAQRALKLTKADDAILILAGKGHNGDDARLAQHHLSERRVRLLNISDPAGSRSEVELALESKPALVIDGLFGIGLNRPLNADWCAIIRAVNESKLPVLAVDNPSGLNVETGAVAGDAIRACITVTLGAPKRGLFTPAAVEFAGRLEVAPEIGLMACPCASDWQWTLTEDFHGFPPPRPVSGHKGTFGHLAILAGSLGYHGAAVLAARGAQRARPGLITVFPQPQVYVPVASQLQAVMARPFEATTGFASFSAVLAGPGLAGEDVPAELENLVKQLWAEADIPVVIDASALDWLPAGKLIPAATRVMTPHPGEAARMLGCSVREVQADRWKAVRDLSARFGGCWVVLKGHQTLVGRANGPVFVNPSGNPDLAQGGSGDTLAGLLAGLLAQPALSTDALKAIRYAVWQHGLAADQLSARQRNWVVEDLLERLGNAE